MEREEGVEAERRLAEDTAHDRGVTNMFGSTTEAGAPIQHHTP
jgi:hypothetical protein